MKICVDLARCALHGQCVIAAPEIFAFAEDGSLKWEAAPADKLRSQAQAAADVCPEQAITIEG